jgi:hypothetical protein
MGIAQDRIDRFLDTLKVLTGISDQLQLLKELKVALRKYDSFDPYELWEKALNYAKINQKEWI